MGFYHHYLATALNIIAVYNGDKPFEYQKKKYYSLNKKHGSKDRKVISDICYSYFRAAQAFGKGLNEENIINCFFLTHQSEHPLLLQLKPGLNSRVIETVGEKLKYLGIEPQKIFPFFSLLSNDFKNNPYYFSFLNQPDVFLRIRPGKKTVVLQKLDENNIEFIQKDEECIALKNATQLQNILVADKEVIIQDYSSQQVLKYLDGLPLENKKWKVWDCCSGSGGKSLLLYDKLKANLQLQVSDIRESILKNLSLRFGVAGVKAYKTFVADLTAENRPIVNEFFDIILCDVPCSGSGTWARTPEQLFFFNENNLAGFTQRQQQILSHAISCLDSNGLLFYITCSVFAAENENIVQWALSKYNINLQQQQYFKGYLQNADNMFVAVFKMRPC